MKKLVGLKLSVANLILPISSFLSYFPVLFDLFCFILFIFYLFLSNHFIVICFFGQISIKNFLSLEFVQFSTQFRNLAIGKCKLGPSQIADDNLANDAR